MSVRSILPWMLFVSVGCAHSQVELRVETDGNLPVLLGKELVEGTQYEFRVTSEQPTYLYAAQLPSNGDVTALELISPVGDEVAIRAEPGHPAHLPAEHRWFSVKGPVGKQQLYLVASDRPLAFSQIRTAVSIHVRNVKEATDVKRNVPEADNVRRGDAVVGVMSSRRAAVLYFWFRNCGSAADCPQPIRDASAASNGNHLLDGQVQP